MFFGACKPKALIARIFVVGFVLVLAGLGVRADTLVLTPLDDARFRGGPNSGTNYDTTGVSTSQGCPNWCEAHLESLFKFNVGAVPGEITSATLRLYLHSDGSWDNTGEMFVHPVTDDAWLEETVTWDTAPGPDYTEAQANAIGVHEGLVESR